MTTLAAPHPERRTRRWWIAGGMVLILGAIVAAVVLSGMSSRSSTSTLETTPIARGTVTATVDGSGSVEAFQALELGFLVSGTVDEVLVAEGDMVRSGQALARLDIRTLQSQLESAKANLASAKANLEQALIGNATPEQLAAQQAAVANAEAMLAKARTNGVTAADIAGAQANLEAAQARLEALKNPSAANRSAAELKVRQAETDLQATRDNTSQAKTQAAIQLQQSVDALTSAQASYATAKGNWEYAQETGNDPVTPEKTNTQGESVDNDLSDTQQSQYYSAYVQAEAALHSAEKSVQNAQVAYDNARQNEATTIQAKEAILADAREQLDALLNPDAQDLVQAQASVDQARAQLQKLQQGGTKADVDAAQAVVEQAKANLANLTSPATDTDLAMRQAVVDQAEQQLTQAELNLEHGTLVAPFAGVITSVDIVPGDLVGSGQAPISLMNRNPLHIDMSLSENDVAMVELGQPVTLTIDALTNWDVSGTVAYIAPAGTTSNGVVTYKVRIDFPDSDERVKVGMTANISIVTVTKDNVLLVPNSAMVPSGSDQVVYVLDSPTSQPREQVVLTGITDGTMTEVVDGLTEGEQILKNPVVQISNSGARFFNRN